MPRSGDIIYLGPGCGVPWNYLPTLFRVIRVLDQKSSWQGMAYIDGYQLNWDGDAVERRTVYVQVDGIRSGLGIAPDPRDRNKRKAVIPRPRLSSDALPGAAATPARQAVTRR